MLYLKYGMCLLVFSFLNLSIAQPYSFKPKPILFVRHGDSGWQIEDVCEGPIDASLNEKGRQQATQAAERLDGQVIKARCITCSALKRARETAQIISTQLKLPLEECVDLEERKFGNWQGRAMPKIELGPQENAELIDCEEHLPPDAETQTQFSTRVLKTFEKLLQNEDVCLFVVSHGGVFKCLCAQLTGQAQAIGKGEAVWIIPSSNSSTGNVSWCIQRD